MANPLDEQIAREWREQRAEIDRLRKVAARAGMLAGMVRHMQPGKPYPRDVVETITGDARHILTDLAQMGIDHPGIPADEACQLVVAAAAT